MAIDTMQIASVIVFICFWPNVKVLPPGQEFVIGVETVELLPVGSDALFGNL